MPQDKKYTSTARYQLGSKQPIALEVPHSQWPRGVTVSTLDSESSDRGSNPREAFDALA